MNNEIARLINGSPRINAYVIIGTKLRLPENVRVYYSVAKAIQLFCF